MNSDEQTTATLATDITVKRSHFDFLYAALRHAGWEVDDHFEGVTTDEGYDHEVKMRLKVTLPLDVVAEAPKSRLQEEDDIERLLTDMSLLA